MDTLNRLLITAALIILVPLTSFAEEKERIFYQVICDDPVIASKISDAIAEELKKRKEYEVSEKLPKAKLFVYAQQDVNDRINANGWSFAIAHVSNRPSQKVISKLIKSEDKSVEEVKPDLVDLLREEGFLRHLNVAHVDRMNAQTLRQVISPVVETFIAKIR